FEVLADEFPDMERQARKINGWGVNVNVKIPITNTRGKSSLPLIRRLLDVGVRLKVTAQFTGMQIDNLRETIRPQEDVIITIFSGRIADAGIDPIPSMSRAVASFRGLQQTKVLWASPREVLNVYQAESCGCHIITATDDLISKLSLYRKPLEEFSRDT